MLPTISSLNDLLAKHRAVSRELSGSHIVNRGGPQLRSFLHSGLNDGTQGFESPPMYALNHRACCHCD